MASHITKRKALRELPEYTRGGPLISEEEFNECRTKGFYQLGWISGGDKVEKVLTISKSKDTTYEDNNPGEPVPADGSLSFRCTMCDTYYDNYEDALECTTSHE